MAIEEIQQVLLRHFDEHQHSTGQKSLPIDARVAQIYDEIDQLELETQVEKFSLSTSAGPGDDTTNETISRTLLHFMDCSVATEVSSDSKESIERIQELMGAVAARRVAVATTLLGDRLLPLSVVLLERVRSAACRCIGWLVKYLFEAESMDLQELEALLDTSSQALVPRFTDKAQSVRQAAIEASRYFFLGSNKGGSEEDVDDPDIRQALQWSLQHDPSVTNRVAALDSIPVTLQTMDVILARVRDVKSKVRVAAVTTLRNKLGDIRQWEPEQCAELVEAGLTDRCPATKEETVKLIVVDWMKAVNFDLLELMRQLNVVDFEASCEKVISTVLEVSDEQMTDLFSEAEVMRFKRAISEGTRELVLKNQVLEVERVFLMKSRRLQAEKLSAQQKEKMLSELLPDIPVVCEMFELHASALMKAITEDKDFEIINRLVSICLNLLALVDTGDIEEGSRMLLKSAMKGMLVSVVTPDDLVEGCIETLKKIHVLESEFWESVAETVETLHAEEEDELVENRQLRILSILGIVLEQSSSGLAHSPQVDTFAAHIVPSVTHSNELVREAAVICFGKLGLFTKEETVMSELKPLLLQIASSENEHLAIRAQATLALCDWSMAFAETLSPCSLEDREISFSDLVGEFMSHSELALVCIAAEAACKLLFRGRVCQSSWLAQILMLYFDPRLTSENMEEENDAKEVGSPVRLQQILTHFFPHYCIRSEAGRYALMGSVGIVLDMMLSKENGKKKRGTKTTPVVKMLDFVLSTVDAADLALVESGKKEEATSENEVTSPRLLVAIQVATFIRRKNQDFGVTLLRILSKYLGGTDLKLEREKTEDLKILADLMEDLGNEIMDDASLQHYDALNDLLEEVDFSEPAEALGEADQDEEGLCLGVENVQISPTTAIVDKENTARLSVGREKTENVAESPIPRSRLSISSAN